MELASKPTNAAKPHVRAGLGGPLTLHHRGEEDIGFQPGDRPLRPLLLEEIRRPGQEATNRPAIVGFGGHDCSLGGRERRE